MQYNLIVVEPNKASFTLNSRKKETTDGAWAADARWGNKEKPKACYTKKLKKSFQSSKQKETKPSNP